jgi:hypothetical protein
MKAPGSPSSALQMRYFCFTRRLLQTVHFLNVGKPAPPRPLKPACLTVAMTSSGRRLERLHEALVTVNRQVNGRSPRGR